LFVDHTIPFGIYLAENAENTKQSDRKQTTEVHGHPLQKEFATLLALAHGTKTMPLLPRLPIS